jgi:hypothetical protein
MKLNKTILVLLLSGAVGGASAIAQQPAQQPQQYTPLPQQHDPQPQADQRHDIAEQVRLVERRSLENELTASNLIGKNVYSTDGENLGSVHDIKLGGKQFAQLRQSFLQREMDDRVWTGRAGARQDHHIPDVGIERTADRPDRQVEQREEPALRDPADQPAIADRAERETEYAADTADAKEQQPAEIIAVIQAGGVLGIGADYVAVPLEQLQYDAQEGHFEIAMTGEQWNQLRDAGSPTGGLSRTIQ